MVPNAADMFRLWRPTITTAITAVTGAVADAVTDAGVRLCQPTIITVVVTSAADTVADTVAVTAAVTVAAVTAAAVTVADTSASRRVLAGNISSDVSGRFRSRRLSTTEFLEVVTKHHFTSTTRKRVADFLDPSDHSLARRACFCSHLSHDGRGFPNNFNKEQIMAILKSADGQFYDIPDDQAEQFAMPGGCGASGSRILIKVFTGSVLGPGRASPTPAVSPYHHHCSSGGHGCGTHGCGTHGGGGHGCGGHGGHFCF